VVERSNKLNQIAIDNKLMVAGHNQGDQRGDSWACRWDQAQAKCKGI